MGTRHQPSAATRSDLERGGGDQKCGASHSCRLSLTVGEGPWAAPLDQGLLAIHAAFPEARETVADWPLGQRNRALAELHSSYFGHALEGWTSCRQCGEKSDVYIDGRALAEQPQSQHAELIVIHADLRAADEPGPCACRARARRSGGTDAAAVRLLRVCRVDGGDDAEQTWSEEELEQAGEKMAAADPLAENRRLNFECPVLRSHLPREVSTCRRSVGGAGALARRLVMDVHALASADGWSEREILALSEHRRRLYLEMVSA